MRVGKSNFFQIQVFQGETKPLEEHIQKVGRQNKEGLLTRMMLEQREYIRNIQNNKSPLRQFIERLSQKVLFPQAKTTPLKKLNQSRNIDFKA